jgi:predicted O-linked N-acetylglucosamine transferase (SPINDLY family)
MSLALPEPAPMATGANGAASARARRAHRRFLDGRALASREQWPPAAKAYEDAAGLADDAAYALAAAHAAIKAGQAARAVERLERLRAHQPGLTLAYTLESHAWLELGRHDRAAAVLESLPPEAPRDVLYLNSLAVALQRLGRHEAAVQVFLQVLALKIDDAVAHFRMGMSFKELGLKAEAAECVRTALALGLGSSELSARALLVFLEREACRWPEAAAELARLRAAVQATPEGRAVESGAFVHAVLVDDPAEQCKVAAMYARHLATGVAVLPRRAARNHRCRLRIGYLSADFHRHATSQLMVQMLENHDRERVEVFLLSAGPDDGTPLRRRMQAASEHFVELQGRPLHEIATDIRAREIDILVDVKGATYGSIAQVMAWRAAPVQVNWLGFPGTSGAECIDYLIGDPLLTPLAHAPWFSEKIAQMPHCYQPNDAMRWRPPPSARADWGAPEGTVLLAAFHQSYKISEAVFDAWCRILHAVPNAVLWLLRWNANVQAALERAAEQRGIPAQRLVFVPLLGAEEHLTRLACGDLYLDAWPCNAHTTAGEALWVGLPPVTLVGAPFAQRVAASLMHTAGLDELVCTDVDAYVDAAVALARDPARRGALRAQLLAQRDTNPLFDGRRFARDIEALFGRMWSRALAGLPPEHLPAEASRDPN